MMWKEFEELAGYEVSYEDYLNIIEPMYMALPEQFTKQDFVKMLDKKRFALPTKKQLQNEMKKLAEQIAEVVEYNGAYDLKEQLRTKAETYAKRFYNYNKFDFKDYMFFNHGYTLPNMRGCSFPVELVIGRSMDKSGCVDYERLQLVKI